MAKPGKWLLFGGVLLAVAAVYMVGKRKMTETVVKKTYAKSEEVFGNPLMGYAPSAWREEVTDDIQLLYMDITWAELEPEEGLYDWTSIEQENQLARWQQEGKHLILRFVCDIPGRSVIWIFPNGCMRRPEERAPGTMVSTERASHRIITMRS